MKSSRLVIARHSKLKVKLEEIGLVPSLTSTRCQCAQMVLTTNAPKLINKSPKMCPTLFHLNSSFPIFLSLGNLYWLLLPKNLPLELEVNKISSWQNFSTKIIFLPIGSNNYQKLIVNIYFFPFVMVANYPYNIKNCWLRRFMKMNIIFECIFRAKVTPNRKNAQTAKNPNLVPLRVTVSCQPVIIKKIEFTRN